MERLEGGAFFRMAPLAGFEKELEGGGPKSTEDFEPPLSGPLPPDFICLCAMIARCCSAISLLRSI